MKRHARIIITSVLIIAFLSVSTMTVILPLIYNAGSSPTAPAEDGGAAAAAPEETQTPDTAETADPPPSSGEVREINLYVTDGDYDFYRIVEAYAQKHWDFPYKINIYEDSTWYSTYDIMSMVNKSLLSGNGAVDIYLIPDMYAPYYLKGEYSKYACTYRELGIDVEAAIKNADIPEYAVGRNMDGEVIALPYLAGTSVFLYRRSIAREVWGTDDPDQIAEIIGGGTQSWDRFIEAAKTLKKHGYYIVTGFQDLSWMIDSNPYPVSGGSEQADLNPIWETYMDISKYLVDNGCMSDSSDWLIVWNNNHENMGIKIFGAVIPPDYYDYHLINESPGDWAICMPPFTTRIAGHLGVMVNRSSPNKDLLGPLVEWITLDCSEEGLQYGLANGTLLSDQKLSVLSGTVLKNSESRRDLLGGQDVNPVIYNILKQPMARHGGASALGFWHDAIAAYLKGEKDKESAIRQFKSDLKKYGAYLEPYPEAPTGSGIAGEEPIVWKDKNLEAAVREILYTPTRDIYESDLDCITHLRLNDRSIGSIEDIVHFKNLISLYLKSNKISDISCLKELTKLEYLDISNNNITDVSALDGLAELRELCMGSNRIADIGSLQGKPYLQSLDASLNNISDISSLSGLTSLESLNLSDNKIVDISALKKLTKLSYLNMEYNDIEDISILGGMKDLEVLLLNGNNIRDISSLKGLRKLKELRLAGSSITDKSPADHVESVVW